MSLPSHSTNIQHAQKVTKLCKHVVIKCNQHHLAESNAVLQILDTLCLWHYEELELIDEQLTLSCSKCTMYTVPTTQPHGPKH